MTASRLDALRVAGGVMRARPADVAIAARVAVSSTRARAILRAKGFAEVRRRHGLEQVALDRPADRGASFDPPTERAVRVALRMLDLLRASCLPRSIALEAVLARRGVATDLVLGARDAAGFEAHAWVEFAGRPVGFDERGAAAWTPLARFRRRVA